MLACIDYFLNGPDSDASRNINTSQSLYLSELQDTSEPNWDAWLAEKGESSVLAFPRGVGSCPATAGWLLRPQRSMSGGSAGNPRSGWWRHAKDWTHEPPQKGTLPPTYSR